MNATPSRAVCSQVSKRGRVESPIGVNPIGSIKEDLSYLAKDENVPIYLRNIVAFLANIVEEQTTTITNLSRENHELRTLFDFHNAKPVSPISKIVAESKETAPVVCNHKCVADPCEDRERSRAVVLSGVPESDSQYPVGRNDDDVHKVKLVVNSLGVECSPVAVYRMGQMGPHPRLLKVVLPTSKHQQLLCNRSRWLRGSQFHGVWLRPSLTKEERDRQRRERLLKEPWKRRGDQTQRSQGIRAYGDPSGVRAPRFQQWNNGGSGNY